MILASLGIRRFRQKVCRIVSYAVPELESVMEDANQEEGTEQSESRLVGLNYKYP